MYHILPKKKLPPMKIPHAKAKTREMPRIEPQTEPVPAVRQEVTDYNLSPLFETVTLITTIAEQKYPGLIKFCGNEPYEIALDHWPFDQVIITSYRLRNKAYVKWLKVEHAISIARFANIKNIGWTNVEIFRMAEDGYPIEYKEYNPQIQRHDSFPVASLLPRGETVLHGGNKIIIHQQAEKFNRYLIENQYPKKAKFSGKTIDKWMEEKHVRRG